MSSPAASPLPPVIPGPPYPPSNAALGGTPTVSVDVPISAVFLALFLMGAVAHMTIFRRNRARGHKFIPSAAVFGFCMARIVANSLRIAWAHNPNNLRLAIPAQVFVSAGVLLLFVVNLIYAQRILRAAHPQLGWSRPLSIFYRVIFVLLGLTLVMVVTVTVQTLFTLSPNTRRIDRDIQLYSASFFMVVSFLPLPILAYAQLAPRRSRYIDSFGTGSWSVKVVILSVTSFLLCLGASFRAGTSYLTPRPVTDPAWYQSRACFYVFTFTVEAMVVHIYVFTRVDKRFYVPDGSSKVRNYGGHPTEEITKVEEGLGSNG